MQSSNPSAHTVPWSVGLCDCCSDCETCGCLACWCPCIAFGRIADIVSKGSTSCGQGTALYILLMFLGVPCLLSCCYRGKMREQFMLNGGCCGDCLRHYLCETLSLTQEYCELKNRGFNMCLGWNANAQSNPGVQMAPAVEQGMRR